MTFHPVRSRTDESSPSSRAPAHATQQQVNPFNIIISLPILFETMIDTDIFMYRYGFAVSTRSLLHLLSLWCTSACGTIYIIDDKVEKIKVLDNKNMMHFQYFGHSNRMMVTTQPGNLLFCVETDIVDHHERSLLWSGENRILRLERTLKYKRKTPTL